MRVIPPLSAGPVFTIATSGHLVSTSIAEPNPVPGVGADPAAYAAGTTYAAGATVTLTSTHRRYRARVSTTGNDPALATPDTPSEHWADIGPTNAWAMFDTTTSTKTWYASGGVMNVVLRPGRRVDAVALAGLANVRTVRVRLLRPSVGWVYDSGDVDLVYRHVFSYYDYCFAPFLFRRQRAFFQLPPFNDADIYIEAWPADGGGMGVGAVVVGQSQSLGRILRGSKDDAKNYSLVQRGIDGALTVVRRRSVPENALQCTLPARETARVLELRDELNAVPAVYVGVEGEDNPYYAMFWRLGIYRRWQVDADQAGEALLNLEVEET